MILHGPVGPLEECRLDIWHSCLGARFRAARRCRPPDLRARLTAIFLLNCTGTKMFLMSEGTAFQFLATLMVKKFLLSSKLPFLLNTFRGSALALLRKILFFCQMTEIAMAVNSLSYNQLVERIITYKASEDSLLLSQVYIHLIPV
jgi:hypothetical protein